MTLSRVPSWSRNSLLRAAVLWMAGWLLLAGCASIGPAPMIEEDLEAFTAGVEAILRPGMNIKDARAALRETMPPPSIDTQVSAPVPSANSPMRTRRFMMAWPTLTRGTSLVLTIFCDQEGNIVRWTTGPLRENDRP